MRDYFIRVTASGDTDTIRESLRGAVEFGPMGDLLNSAGLEGAQAALLPDAGASDCELDALWEVARDHADSSEAEHEVGDLQDLTRLCWQFLSDEQRRLIAATFREQIQSVFE